jgi:uncharacterized protein with HEPN domain
MQPSDEDLAYLWDMLHYCRAILEETSGKSLEHYLADENFRLAIERRIEIIGEAAAHVSSDLRGQTPHIPWRAIVAQRNVLAHAYGEIDDERVWNVVALHVPQLAGWLEPLISESEDIAGASSGNPDS